MLRIIQLSCCFYFKCICFTALFLSSKVYSSEHFLNENLEPLKAYEEGRLLRAQYKNRLAREYLKFAVDQGEPRASFLYAIELKSHQKTIRTAGKAKQYIDLALKNGDLSALRYALFKHNELSAQQYEALLNQYQSRLEKLEEDAIPSANFGYFLLYQKQDKRLAAEYLEKAVEASDPVALMVMADRVLNGEGFYIFSFSRVNGALELYQNAANTGYLPAVKKLVDELEKFKKYEQAFEWLLKAAKQGELTSIATVARVYSGNSETYKAIGLNLVAAKAYYDLYFDYAGIDRFDSLYQVMLTELETIENSLDDEQKATSEEMVESLKSGIEKPVSADFYWFDDGYSYALN
ncbi:sel1 repeat family protein [Marinomonas sp. THO17]